MGAFHAICSCGRYYMWFSFTPRTVLRGQKCDECWKKEGIEWDENDQQKKIVKP